MQVIRKSASFDVQADIILAINEEFNAEYEEAAPWHSLFAEAPQRVSPIAALRVTLLHISHLSQCIA